ncbi:MAG: o-succinylbenzoate synthase [Chloroflexi bacterium]|nr:MAG: o-succinylbenzoate synthase [Chloroflexota bacterium]
MRLLALELRRVLMPLVAPFRTAFGVQSEREALLVRATTTEGHGWGECVAQSEPAYSSEFVLGCELVIERHLAPRLFRRPRLAAADVAGALAGVSGHRMAKAALEMAVLDAELRSRGVSLASHLGGVRERVPAGVSLGIQGSVDQLLQVVEDHLERGYRRVKLKIEPGWDAEPVRAVRERFGPDLALQVDGNGAYRRCQADQLLALDDLGLLLIEQPFPEEQVLAHAELAREIRTPVCLDESITSAETADAALQLGACRVVNVKPGRVGGHLEAVRIHDLCQRRDVPVWCGGMLETGLGRAANLALAALPGFTLPGDLSASRRYYHRDVTPPFELEDGCIRVPDGPGLGVEPVPAILDEVTVARRVLEPE